VSVHAVRPDYLKVLEPLQRSADVLRTADLLTRAQSPVRVKTLVGSSRSIFTSTIWHMGAVPFVVIVADDTACDLWSHDLRALVGEERISVLRMPPKQSVLSAGGIVHHGHVDALARLNEASDRILIATSETLTLSLPSKISLHDSTIVLRKGDERPFEEFVTSLLLNGFERTDYVSRPGDVAVRGGIIDVFPNGWDNPIRIEFWGDTIESLREFEPMSQRSMREHPELTFLARVYHNDDEAVSASIIEHLPKESVLVFDEPDAVLAALHAITEEDDPAARFSAWKQLHLNALGDEDVSVQTAPQPTFSASIEAAIRFCSQQYEKGMTVALGADGATNTKRIRDLFENMAEQTEEEDEARSLDYHRAVDRMWWISHSLSEGFMWAKERLVVLAEHQIFNRQRAQTRQRRSERGITIRELQQLHRGDYVVHADKGVGQFDGLHTISIGGSQQECVKLLFAGGDALYVHMNYVHKLSKFAAEEGSEPKLSKLGSAEWERKKAKAKKHIKDIARDLIKLYAKRKSQPGFAFPGDTVWQKEFEASFQYEDTPDQARATSEVKLDMEQPTPMDRLVCGDVGFGKTEIAIRAAFKAAQSGKQVAVLVPTTILAQQHFVTFHDRLHRYPVRIEVLSRFRSKAEQKVIIEKLATGDVDIVIGTHRLLSKDVQFKQLGLLVIDEEQRFGVAAKEKLRAMRASIDTLTLTATPIPRTLNFSLMGARDLSVIETPPRNRLPIRTEILQWDDDVLREALLHELERAGQAFVVTDRIGDMEKLLMRIKMLVPSLRIAIAHGQMDTEQLENVMEGFLERTFDVLIATKIIESGLDIPNANTIIVINADNFGLAELYQLRGRVGRSNIQAYCFLVIPPPHTLTRVALRRLQALEEFTDLGSGFQLAMRDLEIRGAGNLLGGEQSGFIVEMGFELYQKILEEAVAELRHEEFAQLFAGTKHARPSFINEDLAIELDSDALLPKSYIPTDTDRYEFYRRLYNSHTEEEITTVFAEMRDRFGELPPEADALLFAVRLRISALPLGLVRVNLKETKLLLEFPSESDKAYYEQAFPALLPVITSMKNARFIQKDKRLFVEVQLARASEALSVLLDFVRVLGDVPIPDEEQAP